MTPTWTDADLVKAAKTRPLTPDRLAKVQRRCGQGQWERIKALLTPKDEEASQ